jgi:hypothetical protein
MTDFTSALRFRTLGLSQKLSQRELRHLIELTDLTYVFLKEIAAGEPQGSGLLTIAVIPTGNLAGHAGSNFKGVELSESELGSTNSKPFDLNQFRAARGSNY